MKPPCIRALPQFKKSGCPERPWDGQQGCTAWKEMSVASKGNPKQREIKKQCIDLWQFEFAWATLGSLEGVQIATEGNRNMTAMLSLVGAGRMKPEQLSDVAERTLKLTNNEG